MTHRDPTDQTPEETTRPAGSFDRWLHDMRHSLDHGTAMDVPCGSCTACCRAAQFVHVGADEVETLARLPRELLFPAPGRPGERLLGYDDQGRCPMLEDSGNGVAVCSIYAHRPRACRGYDCRVFAAAGLDPADDGKAGIARQVRRWRFDYADAAERGRHDAVVQAARRRSTSRRAASVTELALIAVRDVTG